MTFWSLSVLLGGALEAATLEIIAAPDKDLWRRELQASLLVVLERLKIRPDEKDTGWRQPKPRGKPRG